MTSKNLYFKLMKEGLKSRLWAICLIGLGFFFTYPVAIAVMSNYIEKGEIESMLRYMTEVTSWLRFGNGLLVFIVILAAVVCGMGSFPYLNSKSKVDFYHGLPVRREKLYVVNYLCGFLVMAIPYAVMLAAGVLIGGLYGGDVRVFASAAAISYGLNLVYYMLMYTVVVLAVMMTGNRIIAYLGTMVFNFIVPLSTILFSGYFESFLITWYNRMETMMAWGMRISPLMEYTTQAERYQEGELTFAAVAGAVLVTVLLAILGGFLYKKRPSEAGGKAIAFEVTKPVIRIMIVMLSALLFGLFFWSIQNTLGWAMFGIICGGVVSHCVIEIIYHFDFKKLFSHKGQLAVCLIAATLILCGFRFDWLGYDRYLPKESQVKNVAIDIRVLNKWTSYGEVVEQKMRPGEYAWEGQDKTGYVWDHMQECDNSLLLTLAERGVANTKTMRENLSRYRWNDWTNMIDVCYTLNSGRKIYRQYELSYEDMRDVLEVLYTQREYKEGVYPVMSLTSDQIAQVRYREYEPEIVLDQLSDTAKEQLLTAYQQDFTQLSVAQLEKELPVGLIRFMTPNEAAEMQRQEAMKNKQEKDYNYNYYYGYSDIEDRNFYPVYASFTNTCQLLAEYGIIPGDDLDNYPVEYYTVDGNYQIRTTGDNYDSPQYCIDEPSEIETLNSLISLRGMTYYNNICETVQADVNRFILIGDRTEEVAVAIPRKQMPEFLKELPGVDGEQEEVVWQ